LNFLCNPKFVIFNTNLGFAAKSPVGGNMIKRRNNNKRNRFTILLPILTIVGIGIVIVLSSFYEKSWFHNWNGVSESLKDSVLIARDIAYTGGTGPNGRSMEKYAKARLWIINNATDSELLNLTKYPNGTVKAIGYEGLIRSNSFDKKTNLIINSINDNEFKVYYSMGCEGIGLEMSEYLIQWFLKIDNDMRPFRPELIVDYGLSEPEKEKILTAFHNRKK